LFYYNDAPKTKFISTERNEFYINNSCRDASFDQEPPGGEPPSTNLQGNKFDTRFYLSSSSDYTNATHTITYYVKSSSKLVGQELNSFSIRYPNKFSFENNYNEDNILDIGIDSNRDYLIDRSYASSIKSVKLKEGGKPTIIIDFDGTYTIEHDSNFMVKYNGVNNPSNPKDNYNVKMKLNNVNKPRQFGFSNCNYRSYSLNTSSYYFYTEYNYFNTGFDHFEYNIHSRTPYDNLREGSEKLVKRNEYDIIEDNNINIYYFDNDYQKVISGSGQVLIQPKISYNTIKMRSTDFDYMNISLPTDLSESTWRNILRDDLDKTGKVNNIKYINNSIKPNSGCSEYEYPTIKCTQDLSSNRVIITMKSDVYYVKLRKGRIG
jgi:hypothetical protein